MNNHIRFSPRASLALTGMCIQQMGIWQMVSEHVTVKQKVMVHTPLEKLQDAFINIMAGEHGLVEVNNRVRPDVALSHLFWHTGPTLPNQPAPP